MSRFSAAGAAFVLAAAMTRVLPESELGQFATAFAIASFAGIYFASSVRRLVMYRPESADVSDLKVAAGIGGFLGVLGAGVVCIGMFDRNTALLAALLAGQRAADGYAEIGQAAWCQRGDFSSAARALTLRVAASTVAAVGILVATHDPVAALAGGLVIRIPIAWAETHVARRQSFAWPSMRLVPRSLFVGWWIALPSAAILLVDAGPTLGVAKFAGFDEAALLTPLGRIRFAVILVATTLAELSYPDMAAAATSGRRVLRISARTGLQFILATTVAAPLIVLCSPVVFGSKLDGEYALIALAVVSGVTMGTCNVFSLGLTAEARISPQIVTYSVIGVLAIMGAWVAGWTVAGVFASQSVACAAAFGVFVLLTRRPPTCVPGSRLHTVGASSSAAREAQPGS